MHLTKQLIADWGNISVAEFREKAISNKNLRSTAIVIENICYRIEQLNAVRR